MNVSITIVTIMAMNIPIALVTIFAQVDVFVISQYVLINILGIIWKHTNKQILYQLLRNQLPQLKHHKSYTISKFNIKIKFGHTCLCFNWSHEFMKFMKNLSFYTHQFYTILTRLGRGPVELIHLPVYRKSSSRQQFHYSHHTNLHTQIFPKLITSNLIL